MTVRLVKSARLQLDDKSYELEFLSDYEIRLKLWNPSVDPHARWGAEPDYYARTHEGTKVHTLSRWVIREISNYLKSQKPPYVFYTSGCDSSRHALYKRIAERFREVGYELAYAEGSGAFYCYRQAERQSA